MAAAWPARTAIDGQYELGTLGNTAVYGLMSTVWIMRADGETRARHAMGCIVDLKV